ncbi:MAG: hypothetical protein FJ130_05475 [Deltaproteobacteria bacterium]|nr:hypothetical protein [Deltaproteobacteria bacterium]
MNSSKKMRFWSLMVLVSFLIVSGCSNTPKTLDRSVTGPQVIVNPESIRLGVAKLMDTIIVFEGSGFKPGDSMFITLIGPNETRAIVAEGPIQPDGTFKVELGKSSINKLTKAMEILKADIVANEKFEPVVVISQPPIPKGVYTVKVTSMLSPLTAETKLTVKGPTAIDSVMDWIGKLTGKIERKKTK